MPFHQRSVEPRRVSRLPAAPCKTAKRAAAPASLDEVSCHTLTNIIHQLADLSRLAADVFLGIELPAASVSRRTYRLQGRLRSLHARVGVLEAKKVQIPVSTLDEESKWTVHYTAPWHQQENVFLPASRPPCVEDLHRQAKGNLKSALRECDKLRKDGFRSSQYYSQGPVFSEAGSGPRRDHDDDDQKSPASSAEEEEDDRSQAPSDRGDVSEADVSRASALPTPEERMRRTAQAVPTDIVAINVTGTVFDRQASVRRSLVSTDTVSRRPKKVKRRKTISGLPDNVQLDLVANGGGGGELRPHSMFLPGQYSTLGRAGSVNSALWRRRRTRDSGCQTEEAKVVPPSMRRIRAQRGQGIAAQMAGLSVSSSTGSICGGGGDPSPFNSLPRQGARVSLSADPVCSSTPIKKQDGGAPHRRVGKLRADDTAVHLRSAPKMATLPGPQEVRRTRSSEWAGAAACVVSPHAAYCTSLIPNATLSGSSQVVAVATSAQRSRSSASPTAGPLGPAPLASAFVESDDSVRSPSTSPPPPCRPEDEWIYETAEKLSLPLRALTSSSSAPIKQLYGSPEASSRTTTDSGSLYSQDNDGYYTSMHLDSGLLRSGGGRPGRHSMYECRRGDDESWYSDRSLTRSISLRKSKKPPPPPTRSDSLKRKPAPKQKNTAADTLNESLLATLQQLGLRPGEASDYEDPWVLRGRSQSSVSADSSATSLSANGVSDAYALCHVTPAHSDSSSLRSDYADSWGYYVEYPRHRAEQSAPTAPRPEDGSRAHPDQESAGTPPPSLQEAKGKSSSPERVQRLTSPSSGYSSQSNTPTAGTPVPSGVRSASPSASRPRPKIPERKSSLLSSLSMSSSSTSLSSTTSDSLKSVGPPLTSAPPTPVSPPSPLPPPIAQALSPHPGCSTSPEFPPPPSPERLCRPGASLDGSLSPPLPPAPPASLTAPPPPPPLPAPTCVSSSTTNPVMSTPRAVVADSPAKSPVLLITPFALQSVQLRSVARTEKETESHPNSEECRSRENRPSHKAEDSAPPKLPSDTPDGPVVDDERSRVFLHRGQKALASDGSSDVRHRPAVIGDRPHFSFVLPLRPGPVQEASPPPPWEDAASQMPGCQQNCEIQDERRPVPGSERQPAQNGDSSAAGSDSDEDDDAGDVFNSNTDETSPSLSGTPEGTGSMVTPTPTPTRTTEDLFAAIHRSKRKVLGRKESEEDKPAGSGSRSRSPPTSPASRPSGSIQRHLRKSSTSSDSFKALLLKKGSRSDGGFRMSAAEMLRSTDPRWQRTGSESTPPDSPPRDERGRYQALAPPASSPLKYGRSRTPPSAASSKYNARCRILSSPMTVICERDGEYADANGTLSDDSGA
ncbi:LOW QUALITY PROTEIN: NHS-like protein 1 [Syngnathus acus]|uniref:LOW QUALITY PROTEIN: NHS-like protein 1 n=1 Tax=Syngnathus acus TaxID=161584 RepID=UPI00188627A9|nr:LOW QUALITY PROTEIN: NHS-like protein 1 [Syngnathus acus]